MLRYDIVRDGDFWSVIEIDKETHTQKTMVSYIEIKNQAVLQARNLNEAYQKGQAENDQLKARIAGLQGELAEEKMDFFGIKNKEVAELKSQLATTQAEVERLRSAISKVMPRLSLAVDPMEDADLSSEGYCDDETCPYCVLKKALSASQPDDLGMDPNAICSICGNKLQIVRPGKYQCNYCEKEEHGKD